MILLHTSDLHLGKQLYHKRRHPEFEQLLTWLLEVIKRENVDYFFVVGDVFDTTTPTPQSTELYYNFLAKISKTCCRHIVIVSGNHDSATLLNAPGQLLKSLDIHVVSLVKDLDNLADHLDEEVLTLRDAKGNPELIVCAVPFLQDRNVRKSKPGETQEEKTQNLLDGIRTHYKIVCEHARDVQLRIYEEQNRMVPIIATGHLYASGAREPAGDGVRDLYYIGTLGDVSATIFPEYLDYVALGHLHTAQDVGGAENIRYSGSPIPIGFSEAAREKSVVLVKIEPASPEERNNVSVELVPVPTFQRLVQVKGDWDHIETEVQKLKETPLQDDETIWLEVDFSGRYIPDFDIKIKNLLEDSRIELLEKINRTVPPDVANGRSFYDLENLNQPSLNEITVQATFLRRLESKNVPPEEHGELLAAFEEILYAINNPTENETVSY